MKTKIYVRQQTERSAPRGVRQRVNWLFPSFPLSFENSDKLQSRKPWDTQAAKQTYTEKPLK